MVWIPTGVGSANLSYLVTHETAHQWFYGLVGNDQAREPFADEALDRLARPLRRWASGARHAAATAPLDLSIYQYSSACYYEVVYIQGGNFLDDIRSAWATPRSGPGCGPTSTANRFKLAPTKTLLDTLDDHTTAQPRAALRAAVPAALLRPSRARILRYRTPLEVTPVPTPPPIPDSDSECRTEGR